MAPKASPGGSGFQGLLAVGQDLVQRFGQQGLEFIHLCLQRLGALLQLRGGPLGGSGRSRGRDGQAAVGVGLDDGDGGGRGHGQTPDANSALKGA
jgi:hypothetical protein